jgi:hypothetical protein
MALAMLFVFFLLRVLLRREWAAAVLFVLVFSAQDALSHDSVLLVGIANVLSFGATVFVLVRFGLLAVVASFWFGVILESFPITPDLSAWYAGIGLVGACLLLGLTLYGFYTSLGGQPLFGRVSLED